MKKTAYLDKNPKDLARSLEKEEWIPTSLQKKKAIRGICPI
jgi:hypothetical protein